MATVAPESDNTPLWLWIAGGVLALLGLGFLLRSYMAKREQKRLAQLEAELAAENSIFNTQAAAPATTKAA